MRRHAISSLLFLVFAPNVYSFEVDGFRTGMSLADAHALIKSRNYSEVQVKDNHIGAWDTPPSGLVAARTIFLTFCKDRLAQMQKYSPPGFEQFARLVHERRKELGRPLDAFSQASGGARGSHDSVSLVWRSGREFVTISYIQFAANSQVDTIYDVPNDCWRLPY